MNGRFTLCVVASSLVGCTNATTPTPAEIDGMYSASSTVCTSAVTTVTATFHAGALTAGNALKNPGPSPCQVTSMGALSCVEGWGEGCPVGGGSIYSHVTFDATGSDLAGMLSVQFTTETSGSNCSASVVCDSSEPLVFVRVGDAP
jgi:hypothetical protein